MLGLAEAVEPRLAHEQFERWQTVLGGHRRRSVELDADQTRHPVALGMPRHDGEFLPKPAECGVHGAAVVRAAFDGDVTIPHVAHDQPLDGAPQEGAVAEV